MPSEIYNELIIETRIQDRFLSLTVKSFVLENPPTPNEVASLLNTT